MKFETRVAHIIPRTYNVKSFRFARASSLNFKAGQYMFVTLKIGEQEARKPFSISSSPTEKDYIEFTKKLTGHPFSDRLDALRVGDPVTIDAPFGNFTFEGESERIGLLSGGVGITPLRSICRYCTDMKLNTKVTLLYGNRTEADVVFRQDLEQMQRQNNNLKVAFTLAEPNANWNGYEGNIDAEMVKKEIPEYLETVFYVCGPPAMVQAMGNLLKTLDVPGENVKNENFAGY
ncbi:MAG: FAD-dependent oxidoreductase [Candidatus Bathyarchaeia archaeon]|jgi:ferredoxin-NADP reductase